MKLTRKELSPFHVYTQVKLRNLYKPIFYIQCELFVSSNSYGFPVDDGDVSLAQTVGL